MLDIWVIPMVVVLGLIVCGIYLVLRDKTPDNERRSPLELAKEEERRHAQAQRIQRKLAKSHR
jgi:hypothetical protein